ncbi:hypothetical protein APX70_03254, partial [Pseudomonas syringae pv. maculicola]
MPPRTL